MGERILVPFDDSPLARKALDRALDHHPDADITILYVMNPLWAALVAEGRGLPSVDDWEARVMEEAEDICAAASDRASAVGREVSTVREFGTPSRTILDFVRDNDIDHVIMGSHSREGVSRLVLGSAAERVMRQAPVPVTIVR
jgi:nucleotide-binding universal stress UspA family protein